MIRQKKARIRLLVREVAEAQGLTAIQLARKADIDPATAYAFWRDPHHKTSTSMLGKLCEALGVRPYQLIEDEPHRTDQFDEPSANTQLL